MLLVTPLLWTSAFAGFKGIGLRFVARSWMGGG
jgi:hypothetical protein